MLGNDTYLTQAGHPTRRSRCARVRLTYRSRVTQRFSVGASVNFESRLGGQSLSRSFYMSHLKPRVFACLFKEDTKLKSARPRNFLFSGLPEAGGLHPIALAPHGGAPVQAGPFGIFNNLAFDALGRRDQSAGRLARLHSATGGPGSPPEGGSEQLAGCTARARVDRDRQSAAHT